MSPTSKVPALLALIASVLGVVFASYSTFDYANHLDRRLHDVHCSFIPGAPATDAGDACRAAMYSAYSAVFKEQYWGGVPISLFAIGAFSFFAGFAVYLLFAGRRAPKLAILFFALASTTPSLVSLLMIFISAVKIGAFCKTCIGIYISSALLTTGGIMALGTLKDDSDEVVRGPSGTYPGSPYGAPTYAPASGRPRISLLFPVAWLAMLALFTVTPAAAYASAVPDHRPYLRSCGSLKQPEESTGSLIHIAGRQSTLKATTFEDPLCPTCKAFHDRLLAEDIYDKLDVSLALFPLDSECNWMLDQPLHPGACLVSRAVICGEARARQVLEWAYEEQEYLHRAGKAGEPTLRAVLKERWGNEMLKCVDSQRTKTTLNNHLHFAADNNIPVSTPQLYLNNKERFCDEDTDLGLRYTFGQLAPEVLR